MGEIVKVETVELIVTGVRCELQYRGCLGLGQLVEDPYEADVNNTPGVMIWACAHCLDELALDI
jgi:hypothetical protein